MERKYKTGGTWTWPIEPQAQTQKGDTTNQYTSGIKNNSKQHYHGQPNRIAKKRRSECSEYQVSVWIVCQQINDPRSSSSLKTIASNRSPFGPFNPIVVKKNKRRKQSTDGVRNNPNGGRSSQVTTDDNYRQHGVSTHLALSSNIWRMLSP